jgi:hypothetical protein
MIFWCGVLQKTLDAGARRQGENAFQEGYHGNPDFLTGDRVGRIPGNAADFPVEFGPKG